MAGAQAHRAQCRWDDEFPKASEDPAPKRQKVNHAQRPANVPRRLSPTAANTLLKFLEVHEVSDRMTIGSLIDAFEEARPQLDILQLHEEVKVATLKVLMGILTRGLQMKTPGETSKQDAPVIQHPLAIPPRKAAKLQSSEIEETPLLRKRKRDTPSREQEAESLAGKDGHKKTDKRLVSQKTNPLATTSGNTMRAAVPDKPTSGAQKRKRKDDEDEAREPDGRARPDIGQDVRAHASSGSLKKAKLGHPHEVNLPKPTPANLPVTHKSKTPRAKEPENRFKLTPSLKLGPNREAGLSSSVRKDHRTTNKCEKPKPRAEATKSVKPAVNHASSRRNPRVADEHDKSRTKEADNSDKPKSKRNLEAATPAQSVTIDAPKRCNKSDEDVSKKPATKEAVNPNKSKPKPTPKATTPAIPIANGTALRGDQHAADEIKRLMTKEPENRFKLTEVYKPKSIVFSARGASRKSHPQPSLRHNKRAALELEDSEDENPDGPTKRQRIHSSPKTNKSILSDNKARPSSRAQKSNTFNMMDFMQSNGVFRQYEVKRPSLEEELAEQDRLTAERKSRERKERRKR